VESGRCSLPTSIRLLGSENYNANPLARDDDLGQSRCIAAIYGCSAA
jgi:hypothetical protein